jgi:hypothetical protein
MINLETVADEMATLAAVSKRVTRRITYFVVSISIRVNGFVFVVVMCGVLKRKQAEGGRNT